MNGRSATEWYLRKLQLPQLVTDHASLCDAAPARDAGVGTALRDCRDRSSVPGDPVILRRPEVLARLLDRGMKFSGALLPKLLEVDPSWAESQLRRAEQLGLIRRAEYAPTADQLTHGSGGFSAEAVRTLAAAHRPLCCYNWDVTTDRKWSPDSLAWLFALEPCYP